MRLKYTPLASPIGGGVDPRDDPDHPDFIPVPLRSARERIRWWAGIGRPKARQGYAIVDEEPAATPHDQHGGLIRGSTKIIY